MKKLFTKWMSENWEKDNMLPPSLDPQEAINFLEQYLLGDDWHIVNPLRTSQANVVVVHEILYKYSKKYKKECKKYRRNNK